MAYSAMLLCILFVIKWIQRFIPDLPNGLGDVTVLLEIAIVVAALSVGFLPTIIAVVSYLLFALIDIPLFLSGMFYAQGAAKFWIYLLDYFLPLTALSFIGLFKNGIRAKITAIIFFNLINYASHILSGVIFWGSYAWSGWGPWAYSLAANGIRNSVMLMGSILVMPFAIRLSLISYGATWK